MRQADPAVRCVSVVEAVADALRSAILAGDIPAGTQLPEAMLSARFDVPRPTVRSAVLLVMQDGLLRREPNRSAYVPVLGDDDVRDLFAVRRLIERNAAAAIAIGGIRPGGAIRALRMLESLDEDDGWDEVVRYDFELHRGLVDAMGSPRTSRIYAGISAEMRLVLTQLRDAYSSTAEIALEHRSLLDAVCSGDPQAAVAATEQHLDTSERSVLRRLTNTRVTADSLA